MGKNKYDESSIQSIKSDRDRVIHRPSIFVPTFDEFGAMHLIFEIFDNSIDELTSTSSVGNTIVVEFDEKTKVIKVTDDGSGIPQGKLLEIFTELYSSGKYNNSANSHYEFTSGVNGVGSSICNFLSDWCEVTSIQKGKALTYRFENGYEKEHHEEKKRGHGTIVSFKINSDIIDDKNLTGEMVRKRCEEKSYLHPNLVIKVIITKGDKKKEYKYTGKNIIDRVAAMKPDTEIITGEDTSFIEVLEKMSDKNLAKKKVNVRFAFGFSEKALEEDDQNKKIIAYGNNELNYVGGVHVEGLKQAMVKFFRTELQPTLNKRDRELEYVPSDIYSGMCGVVVARVHEPKFRGQYKDELLNPEARRAVRDVVTKTLRELKPAVLKQIAEFIVRVARGRLESKKVRTRSKDRNNSFSKERVMKYYDFMRTAQTTNPSLLVLEGDSAIDVALTTRDMYNQGIFPIKKPKNIFDKDSDTESQIVGAFNDIMNICDIQPGKHCDPSKSEVKQILAMTDGDIDGDLIAISIIAMLAKHCRPLIDAGMVGRIVPPAYSFTEGKKKVFVRNQRDFYNHLGKSFVKKHTLSKNGKDMSKQEFTAFIELNFEYNSRLDKLAGRYTCDPKVMEYIASKYHGSVEDQKQSYWKKVLSMYPDLSVLKEEGYVLIDGTIGMEPYHIMIDEYFHKHVTRFKEFQNRNLSITGFKLDGKECTIYEVMKEFSKHLPPDVKRYKGLGELDPEDMKSLCMDPKQRNVVIFKFEDFEDDMEKLNIIMSSKVAYERERKKMMFDFVLDPVDLDT